MKASVTAVCLASFLSCGSASAVYLSAEGRGQALIYPYYSAQSVVGNANNTLLSVVNRTPDSKVIRVRFREGRHGREVASFNLYLGGGDSWTAAVVPIPNGARVLTVDQSCINGPFVSDGGTLKHMDFTSDTYTGTNADGLGSTPERLREGYVEVIEMAVLTGAADLAVRPANPGDTTPANCAAVQGDPTLSTLAPSGELSGTLTIINVANGVNFTVNATALADLASHPFYRNYPDAYPDFASNEVDPVAQFTAQGKTYRVAVANGVDAVAVALLTRELDNEVVMDSVTNSGTDWVMTMPLERLQRPSLTAPPLAYPPVPGAGLGVVFSWNPRDGWGSVSLVLGCFTLCAGSEVEAPVSLPWASTVWSFAHAGDPAAQFVSSSTVLGSGNALRVTVPTPAENGTGVLAFAEPTVTINYSGTSVRISDGTVTPETGTVSGVPALGFMARTFQNGLLQCGSVVCQGNYGGAFPHATKRF